MRHNERPAEALLAEKVSEGTVVFQGGSYVGTMPGMLECTDLARLGHFCRESYRDRSVNKYGI
jgi:hypothetical protein